MFLAYLVADTYRWSDEARTSVCTGDIFPRTLVNRRYIWESLCPGQLLVIPLTHCTTPCGTILLIYSSTSGLFLAAVELGAGSMSKQVSQSMLMSPMTTVSLPSTRARSHWLIRVLHLSSWLGLLLDVLSACHSNCHSLYILPRRILRWCLKPSSSQILLSESSIKSALTLATIDSCRICSNNSTVSQILVLSCLSGNWVLESGLWIQVE